MNTKNIKSGKIPDMDEKISSEEVDSLRKQMYEIQLEVDILKETINVLKKDPGVDWKNLKNREKVAVIDVMKEKYTLPILLRRMELSRSSYYYQIKAFAAGKVYLSPAVDCFDGMLVMWRISEHPNADLVNGMLDDVIANIGAKSKPIIHTDRGCHYRWPGWIERMKINGYTRSMSQKGCSPDNAACEGLLGRIKNEFFYNQEWTDVTVEEFSHELDLYPHWYNEKESRNR